jgi:hypothetical protein
MITLLANGCSHTAGAEIEYPLQPKSYINAWPRWLADDMGWDWVNLAESGNSNEQIKRTTIEWIIEKVELTKRYKPEELVVIIMWAGFNRFEVWNPKTEKFSSYSGISEVADCSIELKEYIKYKTIIDDQGAIEYKNLMDVYLTAKYLESLNIKYYFMNASYNWVDPVEFSQPALLEKYKMLLDAYGSRQDRHLGFSSQEERFWQYMRENKIPVSEHSKWEHWGVEGQKFWKNNVKDWMNRIDNLTS